MRKKFILISGLIIITNCLCAQISMNDGAMNFKLPVYSYADNLSSLSLSTSLSYTSGNGLKLDQVSNSIGTGWELVGIPFVSRKVQGLPDDQMEKVGTAFDTTKYPPGYLYNNKNISIGCPSALNKYPIFHDRYVSYDDDNRTLADRELDNFSFVLNGRAASFIIDKNLHAVLLDDSRLKIDIITADQTAASHIRTTIKEFDITDENGLKYIFSEQETVKLFKINSAEHIVGIFSKDGSIPLNQNPYVTVGWYVTKIIDLKSNRFISFTYNTTVYSYESYGDLKTELLNCVPSQTNICSFWEVTITDPHNNTYNIYPKTSGALRRTEIRKKEINSIGFPNGFSIDFNYTASRKDLPGTNMLNTISVKDLNASLLLKYDLQHSYFIKNEIKDPVTLEDGKWSRLCLTSFLKKGTDDAISENPWQFEYYLGSNNTEDFVAPYFFPSRDPWGYYNGSYSGVPTNRFLATTSSDPNGNEDFHLWSKVSLYNQAHIYSGGVEMYYNPKPNYARNGLLRKIINPYGGLTEYQYEQNYYAAQPGDEMDSYDKLANGDIAIGGVHLSKVIERSDNNSVNDIITEYGYNDDQGRSSMWGMEPLKFITQQNTYWQAADKYFSGSDCKYFYIYPGNPVTTTPAQDELLVYAYLAYHYYLVGRGMFGYFSDAFDGLKEVKNKQVVFNYVCTTIARYIIADIATYVASILISCLSDPPFKSETHLLICNNNINVNLLPYQYKKVVKKVYSGGNIQSGKTVYEFTSPGDFPLLLPALTASFENKPRCYAWIYGLPKSVKYYDNSATLVKSTENEYDLKKKDVQDPNTQSCNCISHYQESLKSDVWYTENTFNEFTQTNITNSGFTRLKVDFYNLVTGHSELKKTTEKLYDHSGQAITTITNYTYDPVNNLLASQSSINSKGTLIENKTYYLEDYDLNAPANSVLNQMKNDHILNVPISTETWQTKPGSIPEMLSCSATEYGISPSGSYRPFKSYACQNDKPIPENIIGQFNPSILVRNNSFIKPVTQTTYDQYFGEPIQTTDLQGGRITSTIFGTKDRLPIASIVNASKDEVAYSSFELDQGLYTGNWSISNAEILKEPSPTGDYCLHLFNGATASSSIQISKDYKLTFWASSSSFNISGSASPAIVGPSISGWTYYEFDLPAVSPYITITGNCKIDELRLYPKNATMVTTTYKPGVGKICECDINNRITYYEYDALGRLSKVLDEHHNIIKTYEYHFKN